MSYRIHAQKGNISAETGTFTFTHMPKGILQRKSSNDSEHAEVPPIVHEVLHSPSQPLDENTRLIMESRFSHDFSKVRVHTDSRAAESANAVNALAYTVGRDIVFGQGQYRPETTDGKRLMAHELVHTIQQKPFADNFIPVKLRIGPLDGAAERYAEAINCSVSGETLVAPDFARLANGITPANPPTLLLQRACDKPESFYKKSERYCLDVKYSPTTHPGKRCYREIIPKEASGCPPRDQCCFDDAGNVESNPDRSGLADGKKANGTCTFSTWCTIMHTLTDYIPAILFEEPVKERKECRKRCENLPWYLKGSCLEACGPYKFR